ncbi:MAG TPA: HWE histidine kinase domain-containing protein [Microvirga sp.]|nr:HWE histidine kinase domain-containing protein [Microvirga sp.]
MPLAMRLLLLVALAVAPALGILAYNELDLRRSREADLRAQVDRSSEQAAAEVRQIAEDVQRLAAIMAKLPEIAAAAVSEGPSPTCSDLLVAIRQDYPGQLEFGVANGDGVVVCNSRGVPDAMPVRGGHFRQALETNRFVVGSYTEGPTTRARYLSFAHPVRDPGGRPVGAVLVGLDLNWLAEHLRPLVGPSHAVLSVHDRELTYLARVPDEGGFIGNKPPPQVQAFRRFADKGPIEATGSDGVRRIGAIRTIALGGEADLHVAYGLSRDAVFEEIDAATRRGAAFFLLSLLLAAAAAWYGGRRFIRGPIEQLRAAADLWREGDYRARVPVTDRSSELGSLAATYQSMADALARREEERNRAEQDLRASEERFRSLANLVPALVWIADREGHVRYLNQRWYDYTGQTEGEALSNGWAKAVHPADLGATLDAWSDAVASGSFYEVELRYRRRDGTYRWHLARADPLRSAEGAITGWFGASIDIDDIRRAEEHLRLLVNELNHRVKNTLATVQSIATQSFRDVEDEPGGASAAARRAFEARLLALARAHDVLTRENWEGADVTEVVAGVIDVHGGRVRVEGPSVRLSPKLALAVSMALHELATNAAKYGALSNDRGHVVITWTVEGDADPRLHLHWRERGGPPVAPPGRKGFGSRLIERSLTAELGGSVRLTFEPDGVECVAEVPLDRSP